MCRFIEASSANQAVVLPSQAEDHSANEWSDGDDGDDLFVSPYLEEAQKEYEMFEKCNKSRFLPKMKKTKSLGTYDSEGHPREEPVLSFGPVLQRGEDLPTKRNCAHYPDHQNNPSVNNLGDNIFRNHHTGSQLLLISRVNK